MTATSERQSAPAPDSGAPSWAERSAFGTTQGLSWWAAILLAVLPTVLGIVVDTLIWNVPGLLSTCVYVLGCVLAAVFVCRKSVFGPMVQPPLVLAVSMPIVILLIGNGPKTGGATSRALAVANPLITAFPGMAIATAATLIIGLLRVFYFQRAATDDDADREPVTRTTAPKDGASRKNSAEQKAPEKPSSDRKKRPEQGGRAPRGETTRQKDSAGERENGRGPNPNREQRPRRTNKQGAEAAERGPGTNRGAQGNRTTGNRETGNRGTGNRGSSNRGTGRGRPAAEPSRRTGPPQGQPSQGQPPNGQARNAQPPRGPAPGRARGGEGPPERGSVPPPRGGTPRPAPGRGSKPPERQPGGEPPRRARPTRNDDSF